MTGLPSYAESVRSGELGPTTSRCSAWGTRVSIGWGAIRCSETRSGLRGRASTGSHASTPAGAGGSRRTWAHTRLAANPDSGALDSNPYGLFAEPGQVVVADAGGNALLAVRSNDSISTLATLPSRAQGRPTDAVPTSVTVGPDGAYYLAQLTGVPFTAGAANVYRVVPGQAPVVAYTGFTTIIDLTFGPDGSLYVLEHSTGPVFFACRDGC